MHSNALIILQHPTGSEDESKEKEHRLQSGLKKKLKNKQTNKNQTKNSKGVSVPKKLLTESTIPQNLSEVTPVNLTRGVGGDIRSVPHTMSIISMVETLPLWKDEQGCH